MNFNLISAIELTACAAIVVSPLSSAFGKDAVGRIRIAAWLSAWFVLFVISAATRALYYEHGLGTPGLGLRVHPIRRRGDLAVARNESLRDAF